MGRHAARDHPLLAANLKQNQRFVKEKSHSTGTAQ
jgi:hypothetical protein